MTTVAQEENLKFSCSRCYKTFLGEESRKSTETTRIGHPKNDKQFDSIVMLKISLWKLTSISRQAFFNLFIFVKFRFPAKKVL